eukprot:768404-Hanusia_phi.AAC.3
MSIQSVELLSCSTSASTHSPPLRHLDALNEDRTAGLGEVRLLGLDNLQMHQLKAPPRVPTSSMMPYSFASSGVMKKSRSVSAARVKLHADLHEQASRTLLDLVERLTGRVRHVATCKHTRSVQVPPTNKTKPVEEGLDEEDLLCLDLNVCSLPYRHQAALAQLEMST